MPCLEIPISGHQTLIDAHKTILDYDRRTLSVSKVLELDHTTNGNDHSQQLTQQSGEIDIHNQYTLPKDKI